MTEPKPKPRRGRKPIPAECKYCGATFPSTRSRRDHQWSCPAKPPTAVRGRPSKVTQCPLCQLELAGYRKMLEHQKTCFMRKKARPIAARKAKPAAKEQ